MAHREKPDVSSRKVPRQARSSGLVAAVLDAAVQVLRREGAASFTTARVAERAGVSVGSVYQYFPNKAAILFRLQADEWRRTSELLQGLLQDGDASPPDRLRAAVHAFIRSECDEAQVRLALADTAPLYRDAPEADVARQAGSQVMAAFLNSALPQVEPGARRRAAGLIEATLTQVGASFSEVERSETEIAAYADAMADMFCAYLDVLDGRPEALSRLRPA